jgi:hypothetical protein
MNHQILVCDAGNIEDIHVSRCYAFVYALLFNTDVFYTLPTATHPAQVLLAKGPR